MIWYKALTGLSLVATAAVLTSACGSGSSSGAGGAGGAGSQASTGSQTNTSSNTSTTTTTSTSTTSTTSSTTGTSSSGGLDGGSGACANPSDEMKLMDQAAAKAAAGMCGQMCALDPMPSMCSQTCMVMKLGISQACGKCWGDTIACGISMCLQQCIADPNSAMCMMCTAMKCEPAFHMCAGV